MAICRSWSTPLSVTLHHMRFKLSSFVIIATLAKQRSLKCSQPAKMRLFSFFRAISDLTPVLPTCRPPISQSYFTFGVSCGRRPSDTYSALPWFAQAPVL